MEHHRREILRIFSEMAPTTATTQKGEESDLPPPVVEEEGNGLRPLELIRREWTLHQQAQLAPPRGWEVVFTQADEALRLISANLSQYPQWYPSSELVFAAFRLTPLKGVRVVLVGQDPYPQGQAVGLAFSVGREDPIPSSLANIFKELRSEYPEIQLRHGDLAHWARQGVLLLNKCLSVTPGQPGSHSRVGWMAFINVVVKAVLDANPHVIFVLWGNDAKQICTLLPEKVKRLTAAHPSGLSASRGFFGCGHFVEVNRLLTAQHAAYLERLISHWCTLRPSLVPTLEGWRVKVRATRYAEVREELVATVKEEGTREERELRDNMREWLQAAEAEAVDWSLQ